MKDERIVFLSCSLTTAVVFVMNEFFEKRICCNKWRKQPGNEESSGTHKKEKRRLFLGERMRDEGGRMKWNHDSQDSEDLGKI